MRNWSRDEDSCRRAPSQLKEYVIADSVSDRRRLLLTPPVAVVLREDADADIYRERATGQGESASGLTDAEDSTDDCQIKS